MKKMRKTVWGSRVLPGITAFVVSVILGMCVEQFSIVSYAQSQAKVIANSAKIRKDASTSSETLGSAEKGDSLTINHQVAGSDGKVWYQVFVNADTLGFIRSDLVEITDGSTPPTMEANTVASNTQTTNTDAGTSTVDDAPVAVTAVNPVSAKASAESVRVRASASTGSRIVASIQRGFALTVNGTADGSDGKVWYQVNFMSDNTEVTGFVRSDYVDLEGELTPYTDTPVQEPEGEQQPPEDGAAPAVTEKQWETQQEGDKWYLLNREIGKKYAIQDFFDLEESAEQLKQLYEEAYSQNKTQKMIVIILVFVLVLMAGAITLLIFKVRDLKDAAYFEEMDREPVRHRTADRPTGMNQNGNHKSSGRGNVRPGSPAQGGISRPVQGSKPRPSGQGSPRPDGAGQSSARLSGQGSVRPGGAGQSSARPSGQGSMRPGGAGQSSARPSSQGSVRPGGAGQSSARPSSQGSMRPGGAGQSSARPSGQGNARPNGAGQSSARPMGQGNVRPIGAPQNGNRRPTGQEMEKPVQGQRNRARNFANEDDEFEFEFLNWDGVDE